MKQDNESRFSDPVEDENSNATINNIMAKKKCLEEKHDPPNNKFYDKYKV
jgi:hypothetical protein